MRTHTPIDIRFSDLDAYGHVNNVSLLGIVQEARIRAFWGGPETAGTSQIRSLLSPQIPYRLVVANQDIRYTTPIPYLFHPLDVQYWIESIGTADVRLAFEVADAEGSACYASGTVRLAFTDTGTGHLHRLTADERSYWAQYQN